MIYFISDNNGYIKIGVADDVEHRLRELQTGNAHRLKIVRVFKRFGYSYGKYDDYELEKLLHIYFKDVNADQENLNSEWFEEKPVLEILEKTDEELNEWFKITLNFNSCEYESYNSILRKRNVQADVVRLQNLNTRKCEEIKKLKSQIKTLENDKCYLLNQVDILAIKKFRG